jgi:UPF0176 protein
MQAYSVLLYYHYTRIENPEDFREAHHQFCLDHQLKGRIIIAEEGINGTISGLEVDCEAYMQHLKKDERFAGIDFKVESHPEHTFQKLYVRVKPEIVHSGLLHINPTQKTGKHLEPEDFKKMKDSEDVVILDVRSNYEHEVGRFKNAITLDINHFREFPEKIKELEAFRDKKIITYCTGGVKCEKASAYLLESGFPEVYQLHGGIVKYGIETGGEDFEGKCYVFDNRVVTEINNVNPKVIATCHICGTVSDRMVNCANPTCNEHFPMCEECGWKMDGTCSEECKTNPQKRTYDGTGLYQKELNGYQPEMNSLNKQRNKYLQNEK